MKKIKALLIALISVITFPAHADEGMWLLQMMQEQHLIDRLKAQGLLLETEDIYSPNSVSLKDPRCNPPALLPNDPQVSGRARRYPLPSQASIGPCS